MFATIIYNPGTKRFRINMSWWRPSEFAHFRGVVDGYLVVRFDSGLETRYPESLLCKELFGEK